MENVKANQKQIELATVLCSVMSEFVPDKPHSVQMISEAPIGSCSQSVLMKISFSGLIGIELVAEFYSPAQSTELLFAVLRLHLQPLEELIDTDQIHLSYERLGKVLAGRGVSTVLGPHFSEYMWSEMSQELRALLDPQEETPLARPRQEKLRIAA